MNTTQRAAWQHATQQLTIFAGRTLYAVQIADNGLLGPAIGSVVKVRPGGTTAADHTTVAGALRAPYGIAIHGHDAYVTTHSTEKDAGQVIRIRHR